MEKNEWILFSWLKECRNIEQSEFCHYIALWVLYIIWHSRLMSWNLSMQVNWQPKAVSSDNRWQALKHSTSRKSLVSWFLFLRICNFRIFQVGFVVKTISETLKHIENNSVTAVLLMLLCLNIYTDWLVIKSVNSMNVYWKIFALLVLLNTILFVQTYRGVRKVE